MSTISAVFNQKAWEAVKTGYTEHLREAAKSKIDLDLIPIYRACTGSSTLTIQRKFPTKLYEGLRAGYFDHVEVVEVIGIPWTGWEKLEVDLSPLLELPKINALYVKDIDAFINEGTNISPTLATLRFEESRFRLPTNRSYIRTLVLKDIFESRRIDAYPSNIERVVCPHWNERGLTEAEYETDIRYQATTDEEERTKIQATLDAKRKAEGVRGMIDLGDLYWQRPKPTFFKELRCRWAEKMLEKDLVTGKERYRDVAWNARKFAVIAMAAHQAMLVVLNAPYRR